MSVIESLELAPSGLVLLAVGSDGKLHEVTQINKSLLVDGRDALWANVAFGSGAPEGGTLEFLLVQRGRHPR